MWCMYTVVAAVSANMQDHLNLIVEATKADTFLNYTVYLSSLHLAFQFTPIYWTVYFG